MDIGYITYYIIYTVVVLLLVVCNIRLLLSPVNRLKWSIMQARLQKEYILETKKFSYQQVIKIYVVVVYIVVVLLVVVYIVVPSLVVLSKCHPSPFRLCQKK